MGCGGSNLGVQNWIRKPKYQEIEYIALCQFTKSGLPCCAVARVIEQRGFNSTPDPFNGQTANFILKPPKVIESRTYVKKANLECYWNNTVLLLWRQHNRASLHKIQ